VHGVEELSGPHEPEVGMLPSEERFDATDRGVEQVDDRLVRQLQLPAGEGALPLAAEADATERVGFGVS
jgi:hypothetical protein